MVEGKGFLIQDLLGRLPTGQWLRDHGAQVTGLCMCGAFDDRDHWFTGCCASTFGIAMDALMPCPLIEVPPLCQEDEGELRCFIEGKRVPVEEFEWSHESPTLYTDGSALFGGHAIQIAAAAVVQLDTHGQLTRWLTARVPTMLPQEAAGAECQAIELAARFIKHGHMTIYSDCLNVVRSWQASYSYRDDHKRPQAGWWRLTEPSDFSVLKIKAHMSKETARSAGVLEVHRLGNEWADSKAKHRAEQGRRLESARDFVDKVVAARNNTKQAISALCRSFDWHKEFNVRGLPAKIKRPRVYRKRHWPTWHHTRRCWVCSDCGHFSKVRLKGPCNDLRHLLDKTHDSHRLVLAKDTCSVHVLVCKMCGFFSSSRVVKLGHRCGAAGTYRSDNRELHRNKQCQESTRGKE